MKFKFQAQDSFLEYIWYIFFEIWRSKKHIALSEKKATVGFTSTGSASSNCCISDEHFFMIKWHSN